MATPTPPTAPDAPVTTTALEHCFDPKLVATLRAGGVNTIEQIQAMGKFKLQSIHGIGPTRADEVWAVAKRVKASEADADELYPETPTPGKAADESETRTAARRAENPSGPEPIFLGTAVPPSDERLAAADAVSWPPIKLLGGIRRARHGIMTGHADPTVTANHKTSLGILLAELRHRYPGKAFAEFLDRNLLDDLDVAALTGKPVDGR